MCLVISTHVTKKIRARLKKSGKIKAWKKLLIRSSTRRGIHFSSQIFTNKKSVWRVGVNRSNRPSKKLTKDERSLEYLDKGIHVYLNKPKRPQNSMYITLPVYGYHRDFIAANENITQAVFMKVTVLKRDMARAIKLVSEIGLNTVAV